MKLKVVKIGALAVGGITIVMFAASSLLGISNAANTEKKLSVARADEHKMNVPKAHATELATSFKKLPDPTPSKSTPESEKVKLDDGEKTEHIKKDTANDVKTDDEHEDRSTNMIERIKSSLGWTKTSR